MALNAKLAAFRENLNLISQAIDAANRTLLDPVIVPDDKFVAASARGAAEEVSKRLAECAGALNARNSYLWA